MHSNELLEKHTEFETKYLTNIGMLNAFQKIVESIPGFSYHYAEGPDFFFENPSLPLTFMRFRRSAHPDKKGKHYQQLTTKTKLSEHGSNLKRKEPNLMIEATVDEVYDFVNSVGFTYTHSIFKRCHIYKYKECTLVFYTVSPENSTEEEHFIEIEVDEETIHTLTEDEAYKVIEKYEKMLSTIEGVSSKKRLKLSLRERYRKRK